MKPKSIRRLLDGGLYRHEAHPTSARLLKPYLIGRLRLATGRIVVADPWNLHDTKPLEREAPVGIHPVYLLTEAHEYGPEALGLAVVFSTEDPVSWTSALGVADDESPWAVPVDSAALALGSAEDCQALARLFASNFATQEAAMKGISRAIHSRLPGATVNLPSGGTAVACSLGGDGGYPVWWGFDANGELACLLVQAFPSDLGYIEMASELKSCPLDDPLAALEWVQEVTQPYPMIRAGRMPDDARRVLLERAGVDEAPEQVLLFWDHFEPGGDAALGEWLEMEPALRAKHGPCLPLQISEYSTIVQLEGAQMTMYVESSGRMWAQGVDVVSHYVIYAVVAHDLGIP